MLRASGIGLFLPLIGLFGLFGRCRLPVGAGLGFFLMLYQFF